MRTEDSIPTRGTLLDRLKQTSPTDQEAWAEFDALYRRFVRAVVMGLRRLSAADVEDVVQDVMVAVSKAMPQYVYEPERAKFKVWLFTVSRNRFLDHLRRDSRQLNTLREDEAGKAAGDFADPREDPAQQFQRVFDEEWHKHLLARALESLKPKMRPRTYQIAYQLFIRWKSVSETATLLGVNRTVISLVKHRVQFQLRAALRRLDDSL